MLGAGMRAARERRPRLPIEQLVELAVLERIAEPIIEGCRPGWRRAAPRIDLPEIMGRAAGREDQHAFLTERCERLADAIMPARVAPRLHRELRDLHIGFRIEGFERHPGAMIEAVTRIGRGGNARFF